MNDEPTKAVIASPRRWKLPLMIVGLLLLGVSVYVYFTQLGYPLYRANRTPGRAWSAWDAADHNVDGKLSREEMELFGKQQPHRDVEQLLRTSTLLTQITMESCRRKKSTLTEPKSAAKTQETVRSKGVCHAFRIT